ncbi:MAG: hypothetical protein ACRDQ4_18310 [Pseudonocardiaceae bacterium]
MTDHTDAADEQHKQALPESVPAPDLMLPPATADAAWKPVISTANGHRTAGPAAVAAARPVVLLRYRPGSSGEATRTVHLVPRPPEGQADAAGVALCGTLLRPDLMETLIPDQGMPCTLCIACHLSADPPPTPTEYTGHGAPG